MKILYIGDIVGDLGIRTVGEVLSELRTRESIDVVVAQAENVSDGKGITPEDFKALKNMGIDFCTGGNWSLVRSEIVPEMDNSTEPIIRPANYPGGTPGLGYKYFETKQGKVLAISLVGQVVGRDADKPIDNPLRTVDKILEEQKDITRIATIVNFHGDYSSEKVVVGHYLDGRVSMVVGDHWHVPTADARILPGGTAHITDVGMCGALDSSLGISYASVVPRWRDGIRTKNELETSGSRQFNALLVEINKNGLATATKLIQKILS